MKRDWLPCHHAIAVSALVPMSVLITTLSAAQSLGDVARRESDRRTQVESGRLYTNVHLTAADPPPPPPAPVVGAAELPTAPAVGKADRAVETDATTIANFQSANSPSGKKDRNYWHTTAVALRVRLVRTKAEAATQRDQLAALVKGPQTPTAVRARDVISKTLTRLQRDAASQELELTRFETNAQLARIPDGWFRELTP